MAIVAHWAPHDWKHAFSYSEKTVRCGYQLPLVLSHKLDSIEKTHKSTRERYYECVYHYMTYHPYASWDNFTGIVYELAMRPVAGSPAEGPAEKDMACLRQLSPFLPPHGR